MPKYRATGPDGRVYQVTAPDEASARAQINAAATKGYNPAKGFGATLRHGFTMGLSDPVQGAGSGAGAVLQGLMSGRVRSPEDAGQTFSNAYGDTVEDERRSRAIFQSQSPVLAGTTSLVAGLGSIRGGNVPGANAAWRSATGNAVDRAAAYRTALRAAPAPRIAPALATGTALGTVSSAANDQTGDPVGAGVAGGATSLGLGLGLVGAGQAAGAVLNTALRQGLTPEQRAARLIQREIGRTIITDPNTGQQRSMTLADMNTNLSRLGAGRNYETVAEIGGPRLKAAARAVANVPGPGQSIAEAALEGRAGKMSDRIMTEMSRALPGAGGDMTYEEALDVFRRNRAAINRQNYDAAYQETAPPDVTAMTMVPAMREAPDTALRNAMGHLDEHEFRIRNAIRMAEMGGRNVNEAEIGRLTGQLEQAERARAELSALAAGEAPDNVSPLTADMFQRGLRQMSIKEPGAPWGQGTRTFNQLSDQVYPALGKARSEAHVGKSGEELMALGRGLLNSTDGEIRVALSGAGQTERDAMMQGVLSGIEQKINANDTGFVARFVKNRNWQNALTEAIGDKAAKRIMTRIRREALMNVFRNYVLSGSRTTPLAEDIRALTEGENELSFMADFITSGGDVKNVVLRQAAAWWRRQAENGGINDPEVNRALASMLYRRATRGATGGIAEVQDKIRALPRYAQGVSTAGPDAVRFAAPLDNYRRQQWDR